MSRTRLCLYLLLNYLRYNICFDPLSRAFLLLFELDKVLTRADVVIF